MTQTQQMTPLDLSFENALKELETVVRQLEEGRLPLEDAITSFEKGAHLKDHCEKLLGDARLKVEEIVKDSQGSLATGPSSLEEKL